MTTTLLFIYLVGVVAGYLTYRWVEKRATGDYSVGDRRIGIFCSIILSWMLFVYILANMLVSWVWSDNKKPAKW